MNTFGRGYLIVQDWQNPPSSLNISAAVRGEYGWMNLDVVSDCPLLGFENETPYIHLECHKFHRFHQPL